MSDVPKRCPVCRGRGALRCDCWPGDCICGYDDEPCDNCEGTGWLHENLYDDDFDDRMIATLVAARSRQASHGAMSPRHHKAPAPKPDKRAKVKAARAQNVKRNRK